MATGTIQVPANINAIHLEIPVGKTLTIASQQYQINAFLIATRGARSELDTLYYACVMGAGTTYSAFQAIKTGTSITANMVSGTGFQISNGNATYAAFATIVCLQTDNTRWSYSIA